LAWGPFGRSSVSAKVKSRITSKLIPLVGRKPIKKKL